jgi:hypothetical protein
VVHHDPDDAVPANTSAAAATSPASCSGSRQIAQLTLLIRQFDSSAV